MEVGLDSPVEDEMELGLADGPDAQFADADEGADTDGDSGWAAPETPGGGVGHARWQGAKRKSEDWGDFVKLGRARGDVADRKWLFGADQSVPWALEQDGHGAGDMWDSMEEAEEMAEELVDDASETAQEEPEEMARPSATTDSAAFWRQEARRNLRDVTELSAQELAETLAALQFLTKEDSGVMALAHHPHGTRLLQALVLALKGHAETACAHHRAAFDAASIAITTTPEAATSARPCSAHVQGGTGPRICAQGADGMQEIGANGSTGCDFDQRQAVAGQVAVADALSRHAPAQASIDCRAHLEATDGQQERPNTDALADKIAENEGRSGGIGGERTQEMDEAVPAATNHTPCWSERPAPQPSLTHQQAVGEHAPEIDRLEEGGGLAPAGGVEEGERFAVVEGVAAGDQVSPGVDPAHMAGPGRCHDHECIEHQAAVADARGVDSTLLEARHVRSLCLTALDALCNISLSAAGRRWLADADSQSSALLVQRLSTLLYDEEEGWEVTNVAAAATLCVANMAGAGGLVVKTHGTGEVGAAVAAGGGRFLRGLARQLARFPSHAAVSAATALGNLARRSAGLQALLAAGPHLVTEVVHDLADMADAPQEEPRAEALTALCNLLQHDSALRLLVASRAAMDDIVCGVAACLAPYRLRQALDFGGLDMEAVSDAAALIARLLSHSQGQAAVAHHAEVADVAAGLASLVVRSRESEAALSALQALRVLLDGALHRPKFVGHVAAGPLLSRLADWLLLGFDSNSPCLLSPSRADVDGDSRTEAGEYVVVETVILRVLDGLGRGEHAAPWRDGDAHARLQAVTQLVRDGASRLEQARMRLQQERQAALASGGKFKGLERESDRQQALLRVAAKAAETLARFAMHEAGALAVCSQVDVVKMVKDLMLLGSASSPAWRACQLALHMLLSHESVCRDLAQHALPHGDGGAGGEGDLIDLVVTRLVEHLSPSGRRSSDGTELLEGAEDMDQVNVEDCAGAIAGLARCEDVVKHLNRHPGVHVLLLRLIILCAEPMRSDFYVDSATPGPADRCDAATAILGLLEHSPPARVALARTLIYLTHAMLQSNPPSSSPSGEDGRDEDEVHTEAWRFGGEALELALREELEVVLTIAHTPVLVTSEPKMRQLKASLLLANLLLQLPDICRFVPDSIVVDHAPAVRAKDSSGLPVAHAVLCMLLDQECDETVAHASFLCWALLACEEGGVAPKLRHLLENAHLCQDSTGLSTPGSLVRDSGAMTGKVATGTTWTVASDTQIRTASKGKEEGTTGTSSLLSCVMIKCVKMVDASKTVARRERAGVALLDRLCLSHPARLELSRLRGCGGQAVDAALSRLAITPHIVHRLLLSYRSKLPVAPTPPPATLAPQPGNDTTPDRQDEQNVFAGRRCRLTLVASDDSILEASLASVGALHPYHLLRGGGVTLELRDAVGPPGGPEHGEGEINCRSGPGKGVPFMVAEDDGEVLGRWFHLVAQALPRRVPVAGHEDAVGAAGGAHLLVLPGCSRFFGRLLAMSVLFHSCDGSLLAPSCWPALWPALHAAACRDAQAAPSLPLHVQVAAPAAPLDADQHRDVAEEVWTGIADLLPAHLLALLTVPELRDTFLVAGFKSSLVSLLHALD